jgi:hypothetical protein
MLIGNKTDIAKKYLISDKNMLVRYLITRFLENYQEEYELLVSEQILENMKTAGLV